MVLNNRKSHTLTWLEATELPSQADSYGLGTQLRPAHAHPAVPSHPALWCGGKGRWGAFPAHSLSKELLHSSQQTQCIQLLWWPPINLLLILNLLLDLCCLSSISVWKGLAKFISHLQESAASHSQPCTFWNSFCWAVCLLAVLLEGKTNPSSTDSFKRLTRT